MLKVVKNNESRKLVDTDDQENELFEPDEIIFHVSQDPITRQVLVEKIHDFRDDEMDVEKITNVTVEQTDDGKLAYTIDPYSKVDISDIKSMTRIIDNIKLISKDIFLHITTPREKNKLHRSLDFFRNLKDILKNYYIEKNGLQTKVNRLKQISSFAVDYVMNIDKSGMKMFMNNHDVELDRYNHEVLVKLLEKLDEKITELWDVVFNEFNEIFDQIHQVQESQNMTKVQKMEEYELCSINLVILEKEIFEDKLNQIGTLRKMTEDNPRYHHISLAFDQSLDMANVSTLGEQEESNKSFGLISKIISLFWIFFLIQE